MAYNPSNIFQIIVCFHSQHIGQNFTAVDNCSVSAYCKYHPRFPTNGFNQIEDARQWVHHFVRWYNEEHRHSQIRYVTPAQRHAGQDEDILRARHELYQQAQRANPARWSGQTRNWQPIGEVWLNPDKNLKIIQQEKTLEAA